MGCPKVDRQAKILFPTNSRVSKTMVQFFQTSDALVNVKKIPVRRVSSIVSRMVHYPAAILVPEALKKNQEREEQKFTKNKIETCP